MNLDIFNNLINNVKKSEYMQNFIKELNDFLDNKNNINLTNKLQKYNNYWTYQNFMEDNIAANIGLSRWATNNTYKDELSKAIDDSILELAEREGALYRKKFAANGSADNPTFMVDKFKDGKIEHLILEEYKIPTESQNEDIIFQYKEDGTAQIRNDLKYKTIQLACEKSSNLKIKENEKATDLKKEGHIYEAFEDDGYIFLNDLTEERDYSLEDIDFVVDRYEGEGKYQVINGEYQKIDD